MKIAPLAIAESSRFILRLQHCDYFSLIGLLLACGSLILALQHQLAFAFSVLLLAMLFDAYDGWVARKLHQQRALGRYLDSNVDVVMHLIVPSVCLYQWGMNSLLEMLVLFLVISSGVLRLAVFNDIGNIQVSNKLAYLGTPVFWYPIIAAIFYLIGQLIPLRDTQILLSVFLLFFSIAMLYRKERYKPHNLIVISLLLLLAAGGFFSLEQWSNSVFMYSNMMIMLALPVLFAGIFHLSHVRFNWLPFFRIPLSRRWFGQNKTWRGFLVMTVFTVPGVYLAQIFENYQLYQPLAISLDNVNPIILGLLLGMASMLGELPNSWLKRRLGIAPGQLPASQRLWVIIGDQLDSAIAVALVYGLYLSLSWTMIVLLSIGLAFVFFLGRLLYAIMGLKQSALQ